MKYYGWQIFYVDFCHISSIFLPSHVRSLLGHAMMRGWINNGVDFPSQKETSDFKKSLILFGSNYICIYTWGISKLTYLHTKSLLFWFLLLIKVTIKNIERELICPACKELFTHPLILPCQHSICHKCVKELLLMLDDSFNDVGSDNSNQSSPRLRLPSPSMDKIDRISRPGMW